MHSIPVSLIPGRPGRTWRITPLKGGGYTIGYTDVDGSARTLRGAYPTFLAACRAVAFAARLDRAAAQCAAEGRAYHASPARMLPAPS